jgi:hypothetical protein
MQKAEPPAERLRLVLALDSEAEPCVQRSKSGLETAKRFVGIE